MSSAASFRQHGAASGDHTFDEAWYPQRASHDVRLSKSQGNIYEKYVSIVRGSRVMTSTIRASLARDRPDARAARRTVYRRRETSVHFFRGVLIGLTIVAIAWFVIG